MKLKKLFCTALLCAAATTAGAAPKAADLYSQIAGLTGEEKIEKVTGNLIQKTAPVQVEHLSFIVCQSEKNGDDVLYYLVADLSNKQAVLRPLGVIVLEPLKGVTDRKGYKQSKRYKELKKAASLGAVPFKDVMDCWKKGQTYAQLLPAPVTDGKGKVTGYRIAVWSGSTPYIDLNLLAEQSKAKQ